MDTFAAKSITPEEPNGIKLETFVFDAIPLADRSIVLEADRATEFSPVKNAEGSDSPDTCRNMMQQMYANWLKKNGVEVPRSEKGELLCTLEISPALALHGEDLEAVTLPDRITPNQEVYLDELSCRPISSG